MSGRRGKRGRSQARSSARPPWAAQLRGVPVGDAWRWSDPDRPGEGETRWGVLWNRALGEVLAIQILDGGTGRVLLLGRFRTERSRAAALAHLEGLRDTYMSWDGGLMYLAQAVGDMLDVEAEGSA